MGAEDRMQSFEQPGAEPDIPGRPAQRGPPQGGLATTNASRIDLVALAAAVLAVSLALVGFQPGRAPWSAWSLLVLALTVILPMGLLRRSPWLLIFAFPVTILAATTLAAPGSWTKPTLQAHPELTAAVLIAYLAAALRHSTQRPNAPKPGSAPLMTGLASVVILAPVALAATAILAVPRTIEHYGPDAARAQILAMAAGMAGLVAVFALALYVPLRSHRKARRSLARMILVARTYRKKTVAVFWAETIAGLVLAILALTLAR